MHRHKITITVDEQLTDEEKLNIDLLIRDAISEFQHARTPAEEYVEKRYPKRPTSPYLGEHRVKKVAQVSARTALARKLEGAWVKVEDIPPPVGYRCGYCDCTEEPVLEPGGDWPRCPNCQAC